MRNVNTEANLSVLYNDKLLADLFEAVDQLHNAASEDQLHEVTSLNDRELVAWLKEVIYTAQETVEEVERRKRCTNIVLHLVEKPLATKRQA
jgi:gluconate kinase